MKLRIRRSLLTAVSLCLTLVLLLPGCGQATTEPTPAAADNQTASPPLEQSEKTEKNLLPPPPKTGNPKLDSALWGLIEAEKRGEAESYARQSGGDIVLVDGNVEVEIVCVSDQLEAAAKAATSAGAKVRLSYKNVLEALVPITSLEALANDKNIYVIRVPARAVGLGSS